MFCAAAPAAQAEPVGVWVQEDVQPISVTVPIGQSADSGLVGVCDHFDRCTGFSISEATSDVAAGTTPGSIELLAYVCVHESGPPCSATGYPFTGVRIEKLFLDVPEAYVMPFFVYAKVCIWVMAPEGYPTRCIDTPVANINIEPDDSGNVLPGVPSGIGVELSG